MKPGIVLMALAMLAALALPCAGQLKVGRAAVDITPPVGIPLAGYYSVRLADGTLDALYAKAIVMEMGGAKAGLVACDLIGLDRATIEAARVRIGQLTGVPPQSVMISATHSHTGPLLSQRFLSAVEGRPLEIARAYLASLPERIAQSVQQAEASMEPVQVSAAVGSEGSVSFNRRFLMNDGTVRFNPGKGNPAIVRPMGPVDPDVGVVYFEGVNARPLATYVNFGLHLDTTGGTRFSADYPATLAKHLTALKGAGMLTVFTIGTAGNVNHIDVNSKERQGGPGEAQRIGTILAGEVLKTYTRLKAVPEPRLRVASEMVALETPRFTPEEVDRARTLAAAFASPKPPPFLDMVQALKVLDVVELQGRPMMAEVQVIALGQDVAWVGLPGEIFAELGLSIKKQSPFRVTLVAELANGSISYVPDRRAYPQGAYEVISARVAEGSGEALVEAAVRLLRQARDSSAAAQAVGR